MLELLLKIVDKLKELVELRDKRAEKVFKEFIEPIYKDMQLIHQDYLETLHKLANIFPRSAPNWEALKQAADKGLEILEPRSHEFEVARDTIRSYVSAQDQFDGDVVHFMNAVSEYFHPLDYFPLGESIYHHWIQALERLSEGPPSEGLYLFTMEGAVAWASKPDIRREVLKVIQDRKTLWDKLAKVYAETKLKVVSK